MDGVRVTYLLTSEPKLLKNNTLPRDSLGVWCGVNHNTAFHVEFEGVGVCCIDSGGVA